MGGASMRRWRAAVRNDPLNASLYSVDADKRQTYWYPPPVWREAASRWRRENGARVKRPFLPPPAALTGVLPWQSHLVGVVASMDGHWNPPKSTHRQKAVTWVVYQRKDITRPFFSPNYGFEGGVFI